MACSSPLRMEASPGLMPAAIDLDQDLARPGNRSGDLHDLQDVDVAVLVESHCQRHVAPLSDDPRANRAGSGFYSGPDRAPARAADGDLGGPRPADKTQAGPYVERRATLLDLRSSGACLKLAQVADDTTAVTVTETGLTRPVGRLRPPPRPSSTCALRE